VAVSQVSYHLEGSELMELRRKLVEGTLKSLIIFFLGNNHFSYLQIVTSEVKSVRGAHLGVESKIVIVSQEQNKITGEQQHDD
jgi:hypothetical protein